MKSCSAILTLSLTCFIVEARQSLPMKTLNCSTDFESHVACAWFELQEARDFVKMHLFHEDKYLNLTEMICNSQKVDSQMHWSCSRNKNIFNSMGSDMFIFKPNQELEVQLNISLFSNLRPLPPQKLDVTVTKEGDFLLAWEADGAINKSPLLEEALDFQITYKRLWETWEESSSLLISSNSHYLFRHDSLIPGSTYIARVRSRPREGSGFSGPFSDWSSVVTWETQGDDALPKNLQCYFNGIGQFKCSWEVRQEVASSVLFTLFYKHSPGSGEKECFEIYEVPLTSHHVLQSCEINVTNPNRQSRYHVSVRVKEEGKEIWMDKNIKPYPPYNLSMSILNGSEYILQWESRAINMFLDLQKIYQISYWEAGKPSKTQEVQSNSFTFTSQFLEQDKNYTAKVRAKVDKSGYGGTWSEWSEEFNWSTTRVFPLWGILLIAVISVILMMAGTCICHKYLLSMKKKWEENIPSPPETFLLPSFFPKVQFANHSEDSTRSSLKEEGNSHTSKQERELLISGSAVVLGGSGKILNLLCSQNMKKLDPFNKATTGQILTQGILRFRPDCDPNAQLFDFNGPYIYSSSESHSRNVQQDLGTTPSEMKKTPVSLQYVGLPPLSLQQQPVGRKGDSLLSNVHQPEEEKLLFSKGQEASQIQEISDKLEKQESEQWRPRGHSSPNSHCQNVLLDYIATEDLSISNKRDSLVPLPVLALEECVLTCVKTEMVSSQLPQTTEDLSNSGLCQKTPDLNKIIDDPSVISQEVTDDYIMNFPATSGCVSKDGLDFAIEEPRQDILLFSLGSRSPVFLYQEGEYCFFPGSRPTKENCKCQEKHVGHKCPEIFSRVTKPPWKTKFVDSKLQVTS